MTDFDQYFRDTSKVLEAEYRRSGGFQHSGTAGGAREKFLEEFLVNIYPQKYVFGDGEIFDSNGNVSKQADVVVYDEQLPVLGSGGSKQFLSAGVRAHIEVKTDLSSQLSNALGKVDSVKSLDRDVNMSMSLGDVPNRLYSAVFAYEGPTKQTFKNNVLSYYNSVSSIEEVANVICVLGEYMMLRNDGNIHFMETGQDSLAMFFMDLSIAAYKNHWGRPDLLTYSNAQQAPRF